MVPLLDLFYFYNKKRQLELVSPEELYQACQQFQNFGFKARLVEYPNNIKMVESTSFDSEKDFDQNFSQYFSDYKNGFSA
jgi:ESCRT-II complex subunit VPS36